MRDKSGRLRVLHSASNRLLSVRQFGPHIKFQGGWIFDRRVSEIALDSVGLDNFSFDLQSSDYPALPDFLKSLFDQKKVLVTSSQTNANQSLLTLKEKSSWLS